MASEAVRGVRRITSNYVRLGSSLALGLVLVPVLIGWVGLEAFGLISLVGASVGFGAMFKELAEQSMVRELGAALHGGDEKQFLEFYNSAYVVTIIAAVSTLLLFGVLLLLLPILKIPAEWMQAARIMIVAQAIFVFIQTLLSPALSMYLVREWFGWYAAWMIAIRGTALLSASILAFVVGITERAQAIALHGVLWAGLLSLVTVLSAIQIVVADKRLRLRPRHVSMRPVKQIFRTFGWNGAVHLSDNLYGRATTVIMNLAFGVFGNAVFELAYRLITYVRMVTTGVTHGLEAVSARVTTVKSPEAVRAMIGNYTKLQTFVALPAGLLVFFLAEPILRIWVSGRLEDPERAIPAAVMIVQILVFASVARAISDGWKHFMYGAGHVRVYAPLILLGGVVNPIVGVTLLYIVPESLRFNAPALAYSIVFVVVHLLLLPIYAWRCFGLRYRDMLIPMTRPTIVVVVCAPILVYARHAYAGDADVLSFALVVAFAMAYPLLSLAIVVRASERDRILAAVRHRVLGRWRRPDHVADVRDEPER